MYKRRDYKFKLTVKNIYNTINYAIANLGNPITAFYGWNAFKHDRRIITAKIIHKQIYQNSNNVHHI